VIPTELGALQKLKHLSMKEKCVGGVFPTEFENRVALETLDLNQNEAKGEMRHVLA